MFPSLLIVAVNSTVPETRADFASGGYTGCTFRIRFASATCPPTRTGPDGAFGFSAGGGGGGAPGTPPTIPPITPPAAPPASPVPPTTPIPVSGGGAASSILLMFFGMTLGAINWFATNCLTTGFG